MLCQWKQVKYSVFSVFLVPVTKYLMKQLQGEEVYSCLEFQRSQFATVGDAMLNSFVCGGRKLKQWLIYSVAVSIQRDGTKQNCDLQRLISQTPLLLSAPQLSKWCPKLGSEPLKHESPRDNYIPIPHAFKVHSLLRMQSAHSPS